MKKYGTRKRGRLSEDKTKIVEYYCAVIYDKNGSPIYVSDSDGILEFNDRKSALKEAEEVYNKFKERI